MMANFNEIIGTNSIEQAVASFQAGMISGVIRIAITLVIAAIAVAKSCNQYGTSTKVMTWAIAALAAAVVWMV